MNCKQLFLIGICGMLLTACSAEDRDTTAGTGQITPVLTADYSVPLATDPAVLTTTLSQPDTKDFAVAILNEDGSLFRSWDSFSDFPANMDFPLGSFVFKATYGDMDKEGFDEPYFEGSEPFQVFDGQNTDIAVTCTLANAKVSLEYTEAFQNYFSDFATTLKTSNNNSIIFSKEETREAYVKPGQLTLQMSLVKPDGSSMSFSPEIFIAQACTHYKIKFDVNDGQVGDAELSITFDETTQETPITINLADGSFSTQSPFVTLMGFDSGVSKEVKELDASLGDLNVLITAPSGFASCTMTTASAYLQEKGWPAQVDLTALTPEQQTLFSDMGLRLKGFENKDKMAYVDFSTLVSKLEYVEGKANHTFSLKATDSQGQATDEVTLSITCQPRTFALQTPDPVQIGSTEAVIPVQLDGDPSLVSVSYEDESGQVHTCSVTNVESAGDQLYNLTVELPVENHPTEISASYFGTKISDPVILKTITPRYTLSNNVGDIWARKATLTVTAEDPEEQAVVMEYLTLYNDETKMSFTQQGADKIEVSGLTGGTEYRFKTTCTDSPDNTEFSNILSVTTEAELGVPNGDFEQLNQTINTTINQGGTWTITNTNISTGYQTTLSMVVSEPEGWASVNAKTCNLGASNKNSWYCIPSTFNTSLSWISHQPEAKVGVLGQVAYDSTADIYTSLSAQNGSNAMVVRNVAWDVAGADVGRDQKWGNTSYSDYYCERVPSIGNRSAGKLFLGTYSYTNGQEVYTEGVAFTSRPVQMQGYYKYVNDSQDTAEKGVVTVQIMNGDTEIGTASAELDATGTYTRFTLPIQYSHPELNATHLRIMFSSSNHADESSIKTTNYNSKDECCSRGAMLMVDNLTFSY